MEGIHMLPNFLSRTGKIEGYKLRPKILNDGGVHMLPAGREASDSVRPLHWSLLATNKNH